MTTMPNRHTIAGVMLIYNGLGVVATFVSNPVCCRRRAVGNVPLKWYKHEDHIGYDRDGSKIVKKGQRDLLDEHLAKQVHIGLQLAYFNRGLLHSHG